MLVRSFFVAVVLTGFMLAGCDSAEDVPPTLVGQYAGTFTYIAEPGPFFPGGPVSQPWSLSLNEDQEGLVSGTGTFDSTHVTILGVHQHPDVTLDFTDEEGAFAGRFTGTLSDDGRELEGIYTLDIFFANNPVTLRRR